jgi:hypothetical protein
MLFSNKYILILITLLLIAGLYFLMKPKTNTQDFKKTVDKRHYRALERDTAYNSQNTQGIYRLFSSNGSLLALTESMAIIIDSSLKREYKILDQNPQGRFFYYDLQKDDTASFDVRAGILTVSRSGVSKQYKTSPAAGNALYRHPYFYFDYVSTDSADRQTVEIRSWNSETGQVRTIANLNELFRSYIDSGQVCLDSKFAGDFFAVDGQRWGFALYRGSYLLTGDSVKAQVHNSIFNKGFVTYQSKSVDIGGGATAFVCRAENEVRYYYEADFHEGKIYALSGIVNERGHADIDVYDAGTFNYLYTLTTALKSKDSYAYIMAFLGNSLYLYSSDGEIIKFNKFQ